MATGGVPAVETLDCPVCSEQFVIPRRLPCQHTICQKCLDELINQQGRCGQCPLCKEQIAAPDTTISKCQWASVFPLDELIQSIVDLKNKFNNEDDYCEPCRGKEKVPAAFWCVNCHEKLCDSCNDYHTRQKQSKHHKTVPIDEKEQSFKSAITVNQTCTQHPGHRLDTFCVAHRALCCDLCVTNIHRDCEDIRDLNAIAKDQARRCNFSDVIKEICQIKTEIDKILAEKMDNRSQIKTEQEQVINDMDIRIDNIIEHLNALRVSFKNETENLYKETSNSIDKSEKEIKCFRTTVTNTQQILESLEDRIAAREKFMVLETIRSQVTSHFEQLKLSTQDDVEIHFSLKANTALHDIEGLRSLGTVQTSKQPERFQKKLTTVDDVIKKLSSMSKLRTAMSAAQIAKPMTSHFTFVKAVKRKNYGRRRPALFGGDGTWFTGGAVLPNGRVLMADYNNNRLVELDEQYNTVDDYKLDGQPRDVTVGQNTNEIYVAVLKGGKYVYKCTLDTDLKVVSRIDAPPGTERIAVIGDKIIVGSVNAVMVLSQDGTRVKSIPKSAYYCFVAVSQKQRTIYHTNDQDVVCRTLEGSELFRYRHQQLKEPRGICTDTHGRTYICGLITHNVHQVAPDGQTNTILELNSISKPWCCVFHPQRNELIVTSHWSEDTGLEVYKLE